MPKSNNIVHTKAFIPGVLSLIALLRKRVLVLSGYDRLICNLFVPCFFLGGAIEMIKGPTIVVFLSVYWLLSWLAKSGHTVYISMLSLPFGTNFFIFILHTSVLFMTDFVVRVMALQQCSVLKAHFNLRSLLSTERA